jgi:predicted nucleic acid-binding protein
MGFLKRLQVVYPREEFELAATITAKLADLRMSIGVIDELIATTAISGTYTLVTATRHFERVREAGFDFKLANWRLAR